jgi:formylglycine-generating enzyme required for sulfatase activity
MPVINLTWGEARQYAAWFSRMTGRPYRLLTEAEWEYAARAGSATVYFWGDQAVAGYANCSDCGSPSGGRRPAPVGSFKPNAFGLYDMAGNVWSYVQDCYHEHYEGAPTDGSAWINGKCDNSVVRGGSWGTPSWQLRAASREMFSADDRDYNIGFRLGRALAP